MVTTWKPSIELSEKKDSLTDRSCFAVVQGKFKTAYCCTLDGKIIAEFESDYEEAVKKALTKIKMPFTSVMEATKV